MVTVAKYPIDYTQCPKYKKIECHDCNKCIAPDCANRQVEYLQNGESYDDYETYKSLKNNKSNINIKKEFPYSCNSLDDMENHIKKNKSREYPDDPGSSRGYSILNIFKI